MKAKIFLVYFLSLAAFESSFAQNASESTPFAKNYNTDQFSGLGTAFGVDMTNFGGTTTLNVRAHIPLSTYIAINARVFYIPNSDSTHDKSIGIRPELVLRSMAVLNVVRVYCGFGPQFFYGISGLDKSTHDISGGWEIGIEVFAHPQLSAHLEIGTGGGTVGGIGAGSTFGAGFQFYPFYKGHKKIG